MCVHPPSVGEIPNGHGVSYYYDEPEVREYEGDLQATCDPVTQ